VIAAHDPAYYRWTQWLFLRFFERDLAYRKESPVNWCPHDQTVLANEQVINGRCERCGTEVEARKMEQWFFRITSYADDLLRDHALIDWPERTKTIQRNWIGRSEGAELLVPGRRVRHRRAGLHDPRRHGLRRDVLRARARASPAGHDRRALAVRRRDSRVRQALRGEAGRGASGGRGEDRCFHGLLRGQPGD
jgi:hypothetical protein